MKIFFALYPAFSLLLLLRGPEGRFKVKTVWTAVFSAGSLLMGYLLGEPGAGALYAIVFPAVGLFPYMLRKEIRASVSEFRLKEHLMREDLERSRNTYEKLSQEHARILENVESILKRYSFAKTLVTRSDEKDILHELNSIFGSRKDIQGLALLNNIAPAGARQAEWVPTYASGWVAEEDWKGILQNARLRMDSPSFFPLPPHSELPYPATAGDLVVVYVPVIWAGTVNGILALLTEGNVSKGFLDEMSIYAQLLGLGLYKSKLYNMVLERSRKDGLTNLYLRRVFLERLTEEISFSRRYGTSFSILIMDLDHFKQINDTYGHVVGDRVLKGVADCLRSTLHPGITMSRYGGEEFCILIGLAHPGEVVETAEQVRKSIQQMVLSISDESGLQSLKVGKRKGELRITVSIGVAHYLPDTPAREELMQRADSALYQAKSEGRNCVRVWKAV
ncbi:MAG: hypothetical protein A2902_02660 [Elusimicrobia bacterium RIFCSPLOWO2_01_FULL_64_13]|nr:MAG: hypothetical protein A2636_01755 [Elusimicrobia bacterium RIFCSPHIGHO2_01_FULL_64_10]OGR95951.1 MAG: hypothetical protein A2902_02660 [Elusimicrobia bacterium RIFCSPLOWO2_01_FULL_64_13]